MHIEIKARRFRLTRALREYVERRLRFALGPARAAVLRVGVRLVDDNGPRGGEDKRCRILLRAAGAPALLVEDAQSDLYVAIDRAAGRAGRALVRQLARRREHRLPARPEEPGAGRMAG
jgi:ribosomal subunit interface protein